MQWEGGLFELQREGGLLDVDEIAEEKGGVLEVFEESEGVRVMKGEKKRMVESRRREMKKEGEKGRARGIRREMEWSEARKGEC
jgi:hypothetical protein